MTAEPNPRSTLRTSGPQAPSDPAVPSGTTAPSGTDSIGSRTSSPIPSLPVPGLPFSMDRKKVLWWGGLAALAAVGVIEWPVAAVVGAGSYVAERWAREDARRDAQQRT